MRKATLDIHILEQIPIFRGMSTDDLLQLSRFLHRKTFFAGTTIIRADEPGEMAYIILEGTLKIHVEQSDGRDVILAILGPGQIVGEMSLADSQVSSAAVIALEDSDVLYIDRIKFQECLRLLPVMTYNLVRILSRRLRLANIQLQSLASLNLRGRVARQLLAFADEYGKDAPTGDVLIPLRLTQGDLADLVGASRVRVNQVLSEYRARGYISVNQDHNIVLRNSEALIRLSVESTKTPDRNKQSSP